jgi:hypothetical protein
MEVDHAIKGIMALLEIHPLLDCTEIVSEME